MATPKNTAAALPEPKFEAWGSGQAEVMAGTDLVDKAALEGTQFCMTGFKFTTNKDGISFVYVEGEYEPGGERFMFNDASTGIRQQVEAYFAGKSITPELEKWYDVEILAPKGLRVSHYKALNGRGKEVDAKTYYITTSGTRN